MLNKLKEKTRFDRQIKNGAKVAKTLATQLQELYILSVLLLKLLMKKEVFVK